MATQAGRHWILVFGLLGNIISFMVFLSPIPTFYQIYKKKSSEGFQAIPYVVALFSAVLWIYYALLKGNTLLLITINSVGGFIETIYIFLFVFYATKKARVQTVKLLVLLVVCGMGLVGVTQWTMPKNSQRVKLVGWISLIFSLCCFIAPLCIARHVIRTKSVEHMPFLLSLFLTLSAVMWFFYGLLLHDFNIAIPNVLGFSFGVLQMVLYKMYKNRDKDDKMNKLERPPPPPPNNNAEEAPPKQQVVVVEEEEGQINNNNNNNIAAGAAAADQLNDDDKIILDVVKLTSSSAGLVNNSPEKLVPAASPLEEDNK